MALQENTRGGALMEYLRAPRANYTIVGEAIRFVIPAPMQCSIGCGGHACKYDNPSHWSDDQQAIKGLYSSWVTDHLLAMSRPSTEIIEKYDIIDQFRRHSIKTVINLQIPGEHASCGNPLEPESGFLIPPGGLHGEQHLFLQFWLERLWSGQSHHCAGHGEGHGLRAPGGKDGCSLSRWSRQNRMTANQAILYVRAKRPGSIQTRGQLRCVRDFVQFLAPLRSVFSCAEPKSNPVTLSQYLHRQRHVLHGDERKELRHLPKIVRLVSRLLKDIAENRQMIEEDILEAPDIYDIEMTLSVIEKLDPDMFAKHPRLPGSPTLPRHFHEPPIFYHRKSLSYSESDLRRLGSELNLLTQPLESLSQKNLEKPVATQRQDRNSKITEVLHGSSGSLWQTKNVEIPDGSIQRSGSFGNQEPTQKGTILSRWKAEQRKELGMNGTKLKDRKEEQSEMSEVPCITLQSELSLDARRLLVAQALAVDLFLEGKEQHKSKVLAWQAELNQGGAWERLLMERDPFILTGLMWTWMEQLKEPVISVQDVKALNPENKDPQTVLNTLDQAPRQTLRCILDCMANLLMIPEKVENAFLNRTIKAFTWVENNSEEGRQVYETMTPVLRCVLEDTRCTSMDADETDSSPFSS
ncbi:unnamed protein product [Pleuronectes platessa]|uniref:Uncharacterized protein n=1 Tax=Pleuronectes platessa TaxID=8262 RepID=A0A9N7U4D4_PLEPL|nr:unnamed protein product [Pleuronectes platessa]